VNENQQQSSSAREIVIGGKFRMGYIQMEGLHLLL